MRIASIKTIELENPVSVYDVVCAEPYNNFLIKTMSKQQYIVSHNC